MKRIAILVSWVGSLLLAGGCMDLQAQDATPDSLTIPNSETFKKLTQALQTYPDGLTPPDPLAKEVTDALESASNLPPEGGVLPKNLDTLALAAAPHPQWHGVLQRLMTRLKHRITQNSRHPEWFEVRVLTEMLAQGTLVPDVDLKITPTGPGKVSVSWTWPGLLIPDRDHPSYPRYLPWPVLASSLAGKFEALLSEEAFVDGRTKILKHWKNLPSTGQILLEGLPAMGQIRMNVRSLEHPEVMLECRLAGYNTMPVLMDTDHPPQGLLTAEGPLLTLAPSDNQTSPLAVKWQLSPTEALCEGPPGKPEVVLDWSGNALKIKPLTPGRRIWSLPYPKVWNLMLNGRVSDLAVTPRRDWVPDLGTHYVWPIGEDRAYGTTKNAVVLYKVIPSIPSRGRKEPN